MPTIYNKVVLDGTTLIDISDTTATASDVAQGKYFYTANGTKTLGTASGSSSPTLVTKEITANGTYSAQSDNADGYSSVTVNVPSSGITPTGSINITTNGTHDVTNYASAIVNVSSGGSTPSATQHTILFEFENSTSTTITAYWDGTFISDAITATTPTSYGGKTVDSASLDGVAWYTKPVGTWTTVYNGDAIIWTDSVELRDGSQAPYPVFGHGETWRFTYRNNTYECKTEFNGEEYYIGNIELLDSLDAEGLPFYLVKYSWGWQCRARTGVEEMEWTTAILQKWVPSASL